MEASGNSKTICFDVQNKANLVKWKVRSGSRLTHGTILLLYEVKNEENDEKQLVKLKSKDEGTVKKLLVKEGETLEAGAKVLILQGGSCTHSVVMKDLCAECGADLRQLDDNKIGEATANASVSMIHSVPELRISEDQAQKLGKADQDRLLKARKLVLLVDLDQTLIHTTNEEVPPDMKGVFHFQLYGQRSPWYHTKIRPGTDLFLEKISKLYELHIFTFGARPYAHHIACLIDHQGKYFSHRILSRDECFSQSTKSGNLKALFPCGDSMVCIIDDREDVWNFAPNMVPVKPYHFFSGTGDINTPPGLSRKESRMRASNQNKYDYRKDIDDSSSSDYVIQENKTLTNDSVVEEALEKSKEASLVSNLTLEVREKIEEKPVEDIVSNQTLDPEMGEEKSKDGSLVSNQTPEVCEKAEEKSKDGSLVSNQTTDVCEKAEEKSKDDSLVSNQTPEVCEKAEKSKDGSLVSNQTPEVCEEAEEKLKDGSLVSNQKVEEKPEIDKELKDNLIEMEVDSNCTLNGKSTEDKEGEELFGEKMLDIEEVSQESGEIRTDDSMEDQETKEAPEEDYLMYLEEILTMIHRAFYDLYDQLRKDRKREIPDLKMVIPYVRRKVLQNVNIVFSGVIPTNMEPEKSKLWLLAKSMGANIHRELIPSSLSGAGTTHLIAAKLGTIKVLKAKKMKGIRIVNPDWLWCCAERWERVDERLYPLTEETSKNPFAKFKRKQLIQPFLNSIRHVAKTSEEEEPKSFSSSYSPLLSFSTDEITKMGQEVDDACSEESENEPEESQELGNTLKVDPVEESTSGESLSGGEFPRGWKRRKKCDENETELEDCLMPQKKEEFGGILESEDDEAATQIPYNSEKSDNSDSDEFNDSIGSVDEEMAAAVEREFLN